MIDHLQLLCSILRVIFQYCIDFQLKPIDNSQAIWYYSHGQEESPQIAVAAVSGSFPHKIIVMHDYDTRHLVICQCGACTI